MSTSIDAVWAQVEAETQEMIDGAIRSALEHHYTFVLAVPAHLARPGFPLPPVADLNDLVAAHLATHLGGHARAEAILTSLGQRHDLSLGPWPEWVRWARGRTTHAFLDDLAAHTLEPSYRLAAAADAAAVRAWEANDAELVWQIAQRLHATAFIDANEGPFWCRRAAWAHTRSRYAYLADITREDAAAALILLEARRMRSDTEFGDGGSPNAWLEPSEWPEAIAFAWEGRRRLALAQQLLVCDRDAERQRAAWCWTNQREVEELPTGIEPDPGADTLREIHRQVRALCEWPECGGGDGTPGREIIVPVSAEGLRLLHTHYARESSCIGFRLLRTPERDGGRRTYVALSFAHEGPDGPCLVSATLMLPDGPWDLSDEDLARILRGHGARAISSHGVWDDEASWFGETVGVPGGTPVGGFLGHSDCSHTFWEWREAHEDSQIRVRHCRRCDLHLERAHAFQLIPAPSGLTEHEVIDWMRAQAIVAGEDPAAVPHDLATLRAHHPMLTPQAGPAPRPRSSLRETLGRRPGGGQ